jgi:hypothetical protein
MVLSHRDEADRWIRARYAAFGDEVRPGDDLAILDYCGLALPVVPAEAYFYRRHAFLSDALRAYQLLDGPLVRGVEASIRSDPPVARRRGDDWKKVVPGLRRLDYRVVEWPGVDGDMRPARRSVVSAILRALGDPGVSGGRDGDYRAAERALVGWCDPRLSPPGDVARAFVSPDPGTRVAAEVRLHVHRLLLIYRDPVDFFERKAPALYREWRATGPDWLLSVLSTWGSAALLSSAIQGWFRTESHGRQLYALALLDGRAPFGGPRLAADSGEGPIGSGARRLGPGAAEEIACDAEERRICSITAATTTAPAVAAWVRKARPVSGAGKRPPGTRGAR